MDFVTPFVLTAIVSNSAGLLFNWCWFLSSPWSRDIWRVKRSIPADPPKQRLERPGFCAFSLSS
jgi:hypothetical protein